MRRMGARVVADRRLEELLAQFRLAQAQVQVCQLQGVEPGEELVEQLRQLGRKVEANPLLREYLEAEQGYGELLMECQQLLADAFRPEVPGQVKG